MADLAVAGWTERRTVIPGYPTLGFDPAPGDPDDVAVLARSVTRAAESMQEVDALLVAADEREWLGEAAVAFRDLLAHQFGPRVADATQAFDVAQRVLWDWSDDLDHFQERARRLEADAAVAQADVDRLTDSGEAEQADIDAAQQVRDDIQGRAWALREQYQTQGNLLAGQLSTAISLAPAAPTLAVAIALALQEAWEDWGGSLADFGDLTFAIVMGMSPALAFVSDLLNVLALIPIPIVSAVLSTIGLAASLGPLLTEHRGDWLAVVTDPEFIDDLAGVAAGVVGLRWAARLATGVDDAAEIVRGAKDIGDLIEVLTLPIQEGIDVVDRLMRGGPWIEPPEIVA